jgi:2-polyprenyl-3-methyl-5-hydroxy-6-metoxy-1,4-benzoquinol methylase
MNFVQLENVRCPLGCPEGEEVVLKGGDKLHSLPGEYSVVKCRTCGLLRTSPRPTAETIGFYYPDNYGPYLGTRVEEPSTSRVSGIKDILRPLVKRIFDSRADALPSVPPGRLLEVGCASGSFLHQMATRGWQVQGIEFSGKAARAARQLGYKVHTGSLENAPAPAEPIDLIVGWMVLEHLHDPIGCLRKLNKWASPGAWLALSVPNAGSLEFQIFKNKWYALQLPTHLHHFTPQTMAKVLEAGGWRLEEVHHQRSVTNLIVSTAYVVESKGWHKLGMWLRNLAGLGGVWYYIRFPIAWALGLFGQTGRITVWARKNAAESQ